MRKIIIFTFLLLLSVSVSNAQDYFGNRSKTSSRVGTEANLPALGLGELYWAQDTDRLYIGRGDGSNRVVYLDTLGVGGISKSPRSHYIADGDDYDSVDCSNNASIFIDFPSLQIGDSTNISFINIVPGVLYTIGIHGVYSFSFPENTIKYPIGEPQYGTQFNYTNLYQFINLDSNKVYIRTFGSEY